MKILVLLGTIQLPFFRLLNDIENIVIKNPNKYNVFAQIGHTPFSSKVIDCIDFITLENLSKYYEQADLIITHAGVGSIMQGLKLKKKIIACARYYELGEHVDNHQLEILKDFSSKNYIIPCYKDDVLLEIIDQIDTYSFKNFELNKNPILDYINNYINQT